MHSWHFLQIWINNLAPKITIFSKCLLNHTHFSPKKSPRITEWTIYIAMLIFDPQKCELLRQVKGSIRATVKQLKITFHMMIMNVHKCIYQEIYTHICVLYYDIIFGIFLACLEAEFKVSYCKAHLELRSQGWVKSLAQGSKRLHYSVQYFKLENSLALKSVSQVGSGVWRTDLKITM